LEIIKTMADKKITCFSMNLIPRISRAQKMDALTSQSNIAGYKAVIMAANELGKIFPLMMTAAGTLHPAKVVVLGAGVAGLQAIATAKRLGALVEASDVRPSVKEQVESLGAKFIEVPFDKDAEDKGGYAKAASPEFLKRQAEEVSKRVANADAVICTALVPGKKAPILVTEEMVKSMRSGSVIVDMAAVQGGNCALTEPGEIAVKHGVKIIGVKNIPATVPVHSTQMYAKNILNLLLTIINESKIHIDLTDEIVSSSLIIHQGEIVNKTAQELIGGHHD
ncbi:NAD(P) transhydrogenase subunit alpha, partial [Candidatus Woesearchaeota archaeon]|nr:NAD(P) transhydrogenase subunit alpha [Candidatus Woesearchaeota archaeon]